MGEHYTEHELLKWLGYEQIVMPTAKKKTSFPAGEKPSLQKHIGTYRKTRDSYVQYRQSGYSKKFLEAHESGIALHRAAKQEFDSLGLEKLPLMDALKTEYATLAAQKNKRYGKYKQARQEMVEHNIDRILNVQQPAKTIKAS